MSVVNSRWIIDVVKYGTNDYHCEACGAIVERDEVGRHFWRHCYCCGANMLRDDGTDGMKAGVQKRKYKNKGWGKAQNDRVI